MKRATLVLWLMLTFSLTGCPDHPVEGLTDSRVSDGGGDAHVDAGRDGGPNPDDAGFDANADANVDAGFDANVDAAIVDGGTDAATDGGHLGPAPVDLGMPTDLASAAAYALLGKSGITNASGTLISGGHVGVSPAAATSITGFALILDSSNQFSTSVSVMAPWRVYAADYAVPTPTNLTSAVLSMEGAYSDAAGRTLPDFLNLSSGNLGGLTLAPGLYHWGTSVTVPSDVTISGGANDVWIFQIANDLDVSTLSHVLLGGSAQAQNIFWQVSGQTTIHANAHFEGIILCSTGITMQTGASLHGRALAQTLIALDNNAITAP
jgi:hypothetical protein